MGRLMRAWDELVSTALLGTSRRAVPAGELPPALVGPAEAARAGGDPATAALGVAALLTVYRRAGARPAPPGPPLDPAPPESLPPVSAAAGHRLAVLLAGGDSELVAEWVSVAADQGLRVRHSELPALLGHCRGKPALRDAVMAVAGERGQWLAALNPSWAYFAESAGGSGAVRSGEAAWTLGEHADRLAFLYELRRADPAAARELLAAGWAAEDPQRRAALLQVLAGGLAAADEPFLEAALDDRRKEVRTVASSLLAELPGSALSARMACRARAAVRLLGTSLAVDPPRECDPAMRRDGIAARAPKGWGERAWWLSEVLARTPPGTWHPAGPGDLVRAARANEWWTALRTGWAAAAVRFGDAAWARALLDADPSDELIPVLPPEERAARLIAGIDTGAPAEVINPLLVHCPPPWPAALGAAVLGLLARVAPRPSWQDTELCRRAARALPAGVLPDAEQLATARADTPLGPDLAKLAALVRLRADLRRELIPDDTRGARP